MSQNEQNSIDSTTFALRTQYLTQSNQSFDGVSQAYLQIISNPATKLNETEHELRFLKSTKKVQVTKSKKSKK